MGREPVSPKGTASETSPLPPGCQGGGGPRDNGGQQASLDRPRGGCAQRPRHSAGGGHRGLRLVIGRGRTAGSLHCG